MNPLARTILLVEDDEADALLVMEALDAHGDRAVVRARDGVEALTYLRDQAATRPELIILDLNMPRMNGHELLAAVKTDPALRLIPTVVLTTSHSAEDVAGSYAGHANAYVTKPVTLDSFNAAVRSIDDFFLDTATPTVPPTV